MAVVRLLGSRTRKDGASISLDVSGIPDGSWQIVSLFYSNNTVTTTMPAGWDVLIPMETTGTRRTIVYGRQRVAGDPTTAAITLSANAQITTTLIWGSGNWSNRVVGASRVRSTIGASGSRFNNIAPSLAAPAKSIVLAFTHEATNAWVQADEIASVSPNTWTRYLYNGQPTSAANNIETVGVYWRAYQDAGASGDATFTYTTAQDLNGWAAQIAIPGDSIIAPGDPEPVDGTLTLLSNIVADGGNIRLAGKVANAEAVRLRVGSQMSPTVVPDSFGYFQATTGSVPAGTHDWELFVDEVSRKTGTVKQLPAEIPGSKFLWGSCFDTYTSGFFALADARNPDFIVNNGDWGYQYTSASANGNTSPTDLATVIAHREPVLSAPAPQGLFTKYPTYYIYSDCDGAGSNADSTTGGNATGVVQEAYQKQFAKLSNPVPGVGMSVWSYGYVTFVQTDETTMASDKAAPDNSSKTKLGAAQKAYFKQLITSMAQNNRLLVWFGDGPWITPAAISGNEWRAYNTERTELGDHIQQSGVKIVRLHGDSHTLFADDGTNNPWGGFPTASGAPFHTTANPYGGTVSHGKWPTVQTNSSRQYGIGTFSESAGRRYLTLQGFSSTNASPTEVERFNMVLDFTPPPVEPEPSPQPWANVYIGGDLASSMYIGDQPVWP